MAKSRFSDEDDELLADLGVEDEARKTGSRTAREERIIAGFEDIERFFEKHRRLPDNGEGNDIFERLYAVRFAQICASEECRAALAGLDKHGLLQGNPAAMSEPEILDDAALLAELGVTDSGENDITKLTHVKTRAEIRAAEEIAKRQPCLDFEKFKPLFVAVQEDLKTGLRQGRPFKAHAIIEKGEFFILSGQIAYVAGVGDTIKAPNGSSDARLRVIYDNGTESDLLMRSLQRALYKDDAGRRITDPSYSGSLFSDLEEDGDIETGTIYILRSKSDHPQIQEHREVIHKIGVTGGDIGKRFANAKLDPTFLMADVEVVATYELSNINRVKLENLIHRLLEPARLDIEITDRFGNPVTPREWFLVPLPVINDLINKIRTNEILNYRYDRISASLQLR